jgi:hypothetical protein
MRWHYFNPTLSAINNTKLKYITMKSFILSAAILAFAGISTVTANEIKNPVNITIVQDSSARVAVKLEDLPEAVKTTLKADAYREWKPTGAFLITEANKTSYYQVDVTKGTEGAFLKIGKDGSIIQ